MGSPAGSRCHTYSTGCKSMAQQLTDGIQLLPRPKRVEIASDATRFPAAPRVCVDSPDSRVQRAIERWLASVSTKSPAPNASHDAAPRSPSQIESVVVREDRSGCEHVGEYRLRVTPTAIELVGASAAACFHGIQTLGQLVVRSAPSIRCCAIVDWPDFPTRAVLHDVTRGKVPTIETLKLLADRLAGLKINQLHLNIEHAYVFGFDSDICLPGDGLTPDEACELSAFCRERFIDLVPALATFGHMGRVLSMPAYRHLAEIEATNEWADMNWPQRLRGFTLDCRNPEGRRLVEHMWSDVLDGFDGAVVNICGDEPHDLGMGKNRAAFAECGTGEAYVEHILRAYEFCTARGRRVQVWADILRNHPELLTRLPSDLTLLHWGYDDPDYEATAGLVDSGLATIVCPGTSGWKRIVNAMNQAEHNIVQFAETGRRCGAGGLLNTDWGDHGHFNLLGCSWHGLALGAALAWHASHEVGADFDRRFSRWLVGTEDTAGVAALRCASAMGGRAETWCMMGTPLERMCDDLNLPSIETAEESIASASAFLDWVDTMGFGSARPSIVDMVHSHGGASSDCRDLDDLAVACCFTKLFSEKVLLARGARRIDKANWVDALLAASERYVTCWNARNKPSDLDRIMVVINNIADDVRQVPDGGA